MVSLRKIRKVRRNRTDHLHPSMKLKDDEVITTEQMGKILREVQT